MKAPGGLSRVEVAQVAVIAGVDPRTVERAIQGRSRSESTARAISAALRQLGFVRHARKVEGKS
jgi:DNA-binding LacI/PurR family transcriptional regulator